MEMLPENRKVQTVGSPIDGPLVKVDEQKRKSTCIAIAEEEKVSA